MEPTDRDAVEAELAPYVAGWRARLAARETRARRRHEALQERLPDIVARLVASFGVRRVVLFGSVARGDVRPESDLDLLVEGLDPSMLIEATVAAERVAGDVHVDLVPADRVRPEVLARIREEGVVLHG